MYILKGLGLSLFLFGFPSAIAYTYNILFLFSRQNEVQRLKEALILQNQKRDDLNRYKHHVQTEYQENTVSIL